MIKVVPKGRIVVCDVCQRSKAQRFFQASSAEEARVQARRQGWRHGVARGVDRTLDACPDCVPRALGQDPHPEQ